VTASVVYATFNHRYLLKTENIFRIDIICKFLIFLLKSLIFFQKALRFDFISENRLHCIYQRTTKLYPLLITKMSYRQTGLLRV